MWLRSVLGCACVCALMACRSAAPAPAPVPFAGFTLALLRDGSGQVGDEARAQAFRQHRQLLERLYSSGDLLVSGSVLRQPDEQPALRGLMVFEGADVGRVEQLLAQDPALEAGLFELAAVPLTTLASVRQIPELMAARERDGASGGEPDLMSLTVVFAPAEAAALEAFRAPLLGRHVALLGSLGGGMDGTLLAVTTLPGPGAVRARTRAAEVDTEHWRAFSWITTPALLDAVRPLQPEAESEPAIRSLSK